VLVEAVPYPELRPEPTVGQGFVRFVQTAGGRPGLPAPRLVSQAPYVRMQGPTVWTTLALTMHSDGALGYELVGASPFPRHWLYDSDGKLVGKSALVDFKTWYRASGLASTPWADKEVAVPSVDAESGLERQLSLMIMRSGARPPKPKRVRAGTAVMTQGDEADDLVLVLDGVMAVEVDGQAVAQVGPGSLLGERSRLESGRRTASVRAVTDCRVVEVDPATLSEEDLRALATGHRREAVRETGEGG
jgi:Cyclic nucleotide-binding domain